jgi:hypothetical protein
MNKTVQIIQSHHMGLPVSNCLIKTTRRTFRCGSADSITYGSQTVEFEAKHYPTGLECRKMTEERIALFETRLFQIRDQCYDPERPDG